MANTKNYDEKTKSILNKILVAARDSSFGYYEDFTIKGYDVDASNLRMTMSVILPEVQRDNAKKFLTQKIKNIGTL